MQPLDDYYKEEIAFMVKSGFFSAEQVFESISELDIEPQQLKLFVNNCFSTHLERTQTSKDVVLLQQLFDELAGEGYVALHNAGLTNSDAHDIIDEVLEQSSFKPYGYIYYHEQDLYRCIETGEFALSFGSFANRELTQNNGMTKAQVGGYFKARLEAKGFVVNWDGSPDQKLTLQNFAFENVYDGQDWTYTRCLKFLNNK